MAKQHDFLFVDFHAGLHDSKWIRTTDYTALLEKYRYEDCFATIQRFKTEDSSREELYIAPLYFDLDYKENPSVAQSEAIKLVDFLVTELCIDSLAIRVYFSGSKGFHIIINEKVFNFEPSNYLHKVFKYIRTFLSIKLGDKDKPLVSLDPVVYGCKRMIRIPNTKHSTTGLYKIELTHEELKELPLDRIKQIAIAPRGSLYTEAQLAAASRFTKEAAEFFKRHLKDYEDLSLYAQDTSATEFLFNKKEFPVCVQHVLSQKWGKSNRNNSVMQLAAYYKEAGFTLAEATNAITKWITKFTTEETTYDVERKITNAKGVIRTIFESEEQYKFGCAFIRSLHGDKTEEGSIDRVPCAGALCPYIKNDAVNNDDILQLRLSDTGNSEYTGKLIRTKVMVAGKKSTPYIVPYRLKYTCYSKCDKAGCPLYNIPRRTALKELSNKDRVLVQMCGVGDMNILGLLRETSGIKNCSKFEIEILESINVEELLVIPMVSADDAENSYVLRKIYSIGNLNISENRYYEIAGYVYPHPRNQEGTIIIQSVKPLQDVIERFKYDDVVHNTLTKFQPKEQTPAALKEKIDLLTASLTYKITGIVERNDILLGALLTYHSPLKLLVPWDYAAIRGWVEVIIVGDTGTGKSAMIEKLMKFVGLGQRVNAESTSRTGLTYKMEQSGSGSWYLVWGAWPLSDKELLWIDEASAMPKEEFGQMTLARSDGKLEVKRAVTAETNCRVRAILTTNAVKGKRLSDYVQGIESLKYMLNNEDIRRFDFALFMKATDVAPERYNLVMPKPAILQDIDNLNENILFAWSRQPENIIFTQEAIDLILMHSTTLANKFGFVTEIPIVSPSDQRNKLARLAASLACLTHNTTPDNINNILVTAIHVQYIFDYLLNIYNGQSCGLRHYAKLAVKEEVLTNEKFYSLRDQLQDQARILMSDATFSNFIKVFASQGYLRLGDIEALLCLEKQDVKLLIQVLAKLKMIVATTSGYRKTPRFNFFIDKCFTEQLVELTEDEKDEY